MKKLLCTFGILLSGIMFVNAQPQNAMKPSDKIVNHFMKTCSLTPDQGSKLKPLVDAMVKAEENNKQKYANNPSGLKSADKQMDDAFKKQAKTFLTADQMTKLSADLEARENAQSKSAEADASKQ